MNRICAAIVLYNGTELTDAAANSIIVSLVKNGIVDTVDNVTIHFLDSETVADILLKENNKTTKAEKDALKEKIANAIAYIGTLFKDTLKYAKETGIYYPFEIEIRHSYISHQDTRKCLDLLATETFVLKKDLAEKYNFSAKVLDLIKTIYKNHHS